MTGHIYVYGEVSAANKLGSVKSVRAEIESAKTADDYVVHIMSPGGDVFEGYGIYNAIKNGTQGKPVVTHIEGLCASIATLIAAAAPKIIMNSVGQFMIHNPHITDLKGDAGILRSVADQLDQIKSILISVYKGRTGLSDAELWKLYDNETYLTADQAVKLGFIDESVDAIKAVALDIKKFKMEKSNSLLATLKSFFTPQKLEKFKNDYTETLADGRVVVVMSDTEDWTGKRIVFEDGTDVPPGDYPLASGKTISVGDGGLIAEVKDGVAPSDQETEQQQMENQKIKELETQLAEARAALETERANVEAIKQTAETAQNQVSKFAAKMGDFEKMQADFLKMKEEMKKTFGDKTSPIQSPSFKAVKDGVKDFDPMGEDALRDMKARNIILQ